MYDGENATGEVLEVFYGGHSPPKEGIYSSLNHMLVIFKSDSNGSYKGFSASYYSGTYCDTVNNILIIDLTLCARNFVHVTT